MNAYDDWESIEKISDPNLLRQYLQAEREEKDFMTSALLGLVEVTSFKTGTDYIQSMVRFFVDTTGVHRAFITRRPEPDSDILETLAFWDAHGFGENFQYDMNGSPCEQVFHQKKDVILNASVQSQYPGCKIIMESYIGIPLFDSDQEVFGHFAIVDDKALPDPKKIRDLAFLFGSRVSTELLRQKAYHELKQKNKELNETLQLLQDMQKQVIHQEKMASLGSLTAGIAHEIKNPLNFVNNFSKISQELITELNEAISDPQKSAQDDIPDLLQDLSMNMNLIEKHGKRADDIVQRMLAHSRGQDSTPEYASVNPLLEESYNLAYHSQRAKDPDFNCDIQWHLDPGIPDVLIYPLSLDRAFRSILENSFTALSLKMSNAETGYDPLLIISTTENSRNIVITITDNGIGIPEEIIDRIFDPFFTTKPRPNSIGLGLSIAYDIICSEHGGEIRAESKSNTTIIIELKK